MNYAHPSDIYMTSGEGLGEFHQGLISTTAIPAVLRHLTRGFHDSRRKKILYPLDNLTNIPEREAPVFVFAHIMAPHPPFVFGPNGEEINPERTFSLPNTAKPKRPQGKNARKKGPSDFYIKRFTGFTLFLNKKLKSAINSVLSESARPPIIILQSDHGPGSMLDWENPADEDYKVRFSILNAYYFPQKDYLDLYDKITPVNTFRVIFNHYFGTNYELLKDESYFSTWGQPYKFINVTDKINSDIKSDSDAGKE